MRRLKGENMVDVRKNNRARILEMLLKYGPISRAEMSQISGLTPPAITALANELLAEGLLEECGIETENRMVGRKRMKMNLVHNAQLVIGVEIGVKQILAGLVNLKGEIICKQSISLSCKDPELVIHQVVQLIKLVAQEFPAGRIIGIGIAATGLIDSDQGIIQNSPNLGWRNIQLRTQLESELSLPVAVDNNVRLMALGENTFLNKLGKMSRLILIHAGYGIGCGIILNDELYYGHGFGAGELGHTIILPKGPLCSCGKNGCLETLASGRAITSMYTQRKKLASDIEYHHVLSKMFQAAAEKDEDAIDILSQAGTYMGFGIINLINLFAPDTLILHGSIFQSDVYSSQIKNTIRTNNYGSSDLITIKYSQSQDELVIMGAGALAIQKFLIYKAAVG